MTERAEKPLGAIPAVQYMRPHGRANHGAFSVALDVAKLWESLEDVRLEMEVLTTGQVSVTISNDEEDLAMVVAENGPVLREKVELMISMYASGKEKP